MFFTTSCRLSKSIDSISNPTDTHVAKCVQDGSSTVGPERSAISPHAAEKMFRFRQRHPDTYSSACDTYNMIKDARCQLRAVTLCVRLLRVVCAFGTWSFCANSVCWKRKLLEGVVASDYPEAHKAARCGPPACRDFPILRSRRELNRTQGRTREWRYGKAQRSKRSHVDD